ncbi:hypothetical protein JVU11DRAFT_6020 [Chiua virens]|nr:hypothetical protein JVU11DRAFT_6020 [Chiua virens]
MHDLKAYSGPTTKLVMGFDIGTTYSGISYCILEPGRVPEILGVTRQVLHFSSFFTFPTQELVQSDAKIPSLLYYDKDGVFKAAGAEVLAESVIQTALAEGWTKAEWWKLYLRPKYFSSSINPDDELPPLPAGSSAVNVLTDFIKYLFQCAKKYIQERHRALAWSLITDSIEYIFTLPNGWEGIQHQLYRRAIEEAGLVPSTPEGRSRVHMLSEGEASLHFCVPNLSNVWSADQSAPEGVVVIDAGGGTIDLSMFSVTSNPISCEEIAPAECRLQGSVFVTRRARVLLQRKLQGWEHSGDEEISEFTREFDQSTKLIIKTDQEPAYVRVAGRRYTNSKYGISAGKLRLSGEEATGLFNDSVDAITSAFEQQQKHATIPITAAFLVGGLSTNDWLWSRIQSYFQTRNIKACRPDSYISKVVPNGAVLSHVDRDNHRVASRVARATYGVVCALPVKENDEQHIDRKALWEKDPAGKYYVPGYFDSKLRKGAQVREEMEFRESFSLTENNPKDFGMQTVRFVCYRGNLSDPKWVDQDRCESCLQHSFFLLTSNIVASFSIEFTIRADLSKATKDLVMMKSSGKVYYQLDYHVTIFFGFTELQAELGWKTKNGEQRIPAVISYTD